MEGSYAETVNAQDLEWAEKRYTKATGLIRKPDRFRRRVLDQFQSRENVEYLREVFGRAISEEAMPATRAYVLDTLRDSVMSYERARDLLDSDDLGQRGMSRPAGNVWHEIRRINTAFYRDKMQFVNTAWYDFEGKPRPFDDQNEPLSYQMFVGDYLRPPGFEHLNDSGPAYEITEERSFNDGSIRDPRAAAGKRRSYDERAASNVLDWISRGPTSTLGRAELISGGTRMKNIDVWDGGRAQRYVGIPRFNRISRLAVAQETDNGETLQSFEYEGSNRGWDMSRIRQPIGEESRRLGWTSQDGIMY